MQVVFDQAYPPNTVEFSSIIRAVNAAGAGPWSTVSVVPAALAGSGYYFANCTDVNLAGAAPLRRTQAGYRTGLDRDNDGIACLSGNDY